MCRVVSSETHSTLAKLSVSGEPVPVRRYDIPSAIPVVILRMATRIALSYTWGGSLKVRGTFLVSPTPLVLGFIGLRGHRLAVFASHSRALAARS